MDLNTEKIVFAVKIINLNAEILVKKIIIAFIFEIDDINIHTIMVLINQNIIVLLQIFVLEFEI